MTMPRKGFEFGDIRVLVVQYRNTKFHGHCTRQKEYLIFLKKLLNYRQIFFVRLERMDG